MDSDRLDEIISKSKNEIETTLEQENPDLEELKQLLEAEKDEKDRKNVKDLLEDLIFSKQLLEAVEEDRGFFENIQTIQNSLDDIKDAEKLSELDSDYDRVETLDQLFGTVKEFKDYADNLDLDSDEAELILKVEISGKNRKGVKDYLKDKIDYFRDGKTKEERKNELKDELGLDIDKEVLENTSLRKLENIKKEKSHREKLITNISEEVDESAEKLRKLSTSDLEKIGSEVSS